MRSILFEIPNHIDSLPWPLFGWGLLLAVWGVIVAGVLAWTVRRHGVGPELTAQVPIVLLFGVAIVVLIPSMLDDQRMSALFDYLDTVSPGRHRGVIAQDEARDALRDDFAAVDVNHDGFVDRREVTRYYGQLPVRGFGVMLLVATTLALALGVHRARQMRVHPDLMFSLVFWLFVSGILGARAFYVVQYWQDFQQPRLADTLKQVFSVQQGGLVVYGSVIGGLLGIVLFTRRHRLPLLPLTDLIAPSLALAQAFGRIGCFLNGCCYGGPCALPWAMTFPVASPPFMRQFEEGEVDIEGLFLAGKSAPDKPAPAQVTGVRPGSPAANEGFKEGERINFINGVAVFRQEEARGELIHNAQPGREVSIQVTGASSPRVWRVAGPLPRSQPVHPTQLYSFIDGSVICLFLLAYWPYRRRDGEITAWLLTLYPTTRFLMEIVRTDEPGRFGTSLSISQFVSLAVLAAAALLWWRLRSRPRGSVFDHSPSGAWLFA